MKDFLARKMDSVALALGALLAIAIIAAYVGGVGMITTNLDTTLNPDTTNAPAPTYNLEAAAALDLKGLSASR